MEDELTDLIQEQQERLEYRIEGSKIRFEENLRKIHHELKTGVLPWLRDSELRNVISAPFIYAMIVPLALLDIFVTAYQAICFPLYRIPKVRRSSYVVLDRHHLGYRVSGCLCPNPDSLASVARPGDHHHPHTADDQRRGAFVWVDDPTGQQRPH